MALPSANLASDATTCGGPGWFLKQDTDRGISKMVVASHLEVHDEIYDFLEKHSLIDLVENPEYRTMSMASFVKGVRARRAFKQAGGRLGTWTLRPLVWRTPSFCSGNGRRRCGERYCRELLR